MWQYPLSDVQRNPDSSKDWKSRWLFPCVRMRMQITKPSCSLCHWPCFDKQLLQGRKSGKLLQLKFFHCCKCTLDLIRILTFSHLIPFFLGRQSSASASMRARSKIIQSPRKIFILGGNKKSVQNLQTKKSKMCHLTW